MTTLSIKQKKEIRADAKNHVLSGGAFPDYNNEDFREENFFQSIHIEYDTEEEDELFLEALDDLQGKCIEAVSKWKP